MFDDGDLFTDHENTILYQNHSWGNVYEKKAAYQLFYENYNESSDVPFHYRVGRARCEKKLASDCVIRFTILEYGVKSNMVTSLRGSSVVFCLMISGDEIR